MSELMPSPETPLTWRPAAQGEREVYRAECGPYEFEIRATASGGYLLRVWETRPEDRPMPIQPEDAYGPLLFFTAEGLSLEAARGRAAQLVLPDALRPELVLHLRVRPQDSEPLRAVEPRPIVTPALMAGAVGRAVVERPEGMRQVTRAHRNRLALKTWSAAVWPPVPSVESSRPSPPCSTTFARSTRSATTRCAGSSAPKRRATRARRRHSRDGQARALAYDANAYVFPSFDGEQRKEVLSSA